MIGFSSGTSKTRIKRYMDAIKADKEKKKQKSINLKYELI
jgi:hypothetical protein